MDALVSHKPFVVKSKRIRAINCTNYIVANPELRKVVSVVEHHSNHSFNVRNQWNAEIYDGSDVSMLVKVINQALLGKR